MVIKRPKSGSHVIKEEKVSVTPEAMDVSLNPEVEKNWRRVVVGILIGPAMPGKDEKESKPISKTAIKKAETERRVLERSKNKIEWIAFKQMISDRQDEIIAKLNKYERQTVADLHELAHLRKADVGTNLGGKPPVIMALIRDDLTKTEESGSKAGKKATSKASSSSSSSNS